MKEQILVLFQEIPGVAVHDFYFGTDGLIYLEATVIDPTINQGLIEASLARVINKVNKDFKDYITQEKIKMMPTENSLKC